MGWGTPRRGNKYGAKKQVYANQTYDSMGEALYAQHLDALKFAGQIADWRRGREWLLLEPPNKIALNPDFEVWTGPVTFLMVGRLVKRKWVEVEQPSRPPDRLVDFKGMVTPVWKLKAKLFKARYPSIPLLIVKADGVEVAA